MRKNISTVLLSAAVLVLFAGCTKDSNLEIVKSKVFSGSIEAPVATKVTLDRQTAGGRICWLSSDAIKINGETYNCTPSTANPTFATFVADGTEAQPQGGKYYAWYPYNLQQDNSFVLNNKCIFNGNNLGLLFPMYAESENTTFNFKNLCGVLEIILKGSKPIDTIVVSDGEKSLSGAFTISEDGKAVITDHSSKATLTLLCQNAKLTEDGVAFYFAVPAETYNSLKIQVNSADGISWEATAKKAATIERSKIYSLEFTPELGSSEHNSVQLWAGGPYWATENIGALEPVESGLYFAWGELNGYKVTIDGSNAYFTGEYPDRDFSKEDLYKHALDFSQLDLTGKDKQYDQAYAIWGEGWRMPTKEEASKLAELDIEAEYDNNDAVIAYTVSSDLGSVTFPVSGKLNKASGLGLGSSNAACFWTSTPKTVGGSHDVYLMQMTSSVAVKTTREYNGVPVRPVRDSK